MFNVIEKEGDKKKVTVYAVIEDQGQAWFLVFEEGKWVWKHANAYLPIDAPETYFQLSKNIEIY